MWGSKTLFWDAPEGNENASIGPQSGQHARDADLWGKTA